MANKNRIEDSELIITDKGAIYHLNLMPDQVGETIITVGDPDRIKLVSDILVQEHGYKVQYRVQHREFVTHTLQHGHKKLSVISTGIGPDNIDIVFSELDALVNIDFETRLVKEDLKSLNIIRLGTSGGLQPDLAPGSFVVSAKAIGLDNLMHFYKHESTTDEVAMNAALAAHLQLGDNPLKPYVVSASEELLQKFTDGYHHGITVTSPGFFAPQGRWLRGDLTHPTLVDKLMDFGFGDYKVSNMEMETSAILGLGGLLGHKCLSISLNINNRQTKEFIKDMPGDLDRMLRKSVAIIASL